MKSIQEAVASVQNAPGSMYTREDVISLLSNLTADATPKLSPEIIEKLIESVKEAVSSRMSNLDTEDLVDTGSAGFELNYNEISLSSVDVDTSNISDAIGEVVEDTINEFFEEGGFLSEDRDDIVEIERAS